jgi:hypothetical protein
MRPSLSSPYVFAVVLSCASWGADAFGQAARPLSPSSPSSSVPPPPQAHETPAQQGAATAPLAPAQSAVVAPTAAEIRFRRVTVEVASDKPDTVVERRVSVKEDMGAFLVLPYRTVGATWEQVCVTPCQVDLDRYSTYRVSQQNGVTQSHAFTIPQGRDALRLDVNAGNATIHHVGLFLSGVGLVAVIVGLSLIVDAQNVVVPSHERETRAAGIITGGVGVASMAAGIPLSFMTLTHVKSDSGQKVSDVTPEGGHRLPFLPDIKLGKSLTLTQRGFVF